MAKQAGRDRDDRPVGKLLTGAGGSRGGVAAGPGAWTATPSIPRAPQARMTIKQPGLPAPRLFVYSMAPSPERTSGDVFLELPASRGVAQFLERLDLDLPDPLPASG